MMLYSLSLLLSLISISHARSPCRELPDGGPCKAFFERYHYNQTTRTCESFVWGGCGGNVPFETLEECEDAKCDAPRCMQAPDPGPCRTFSDRYYYNTTTDSCEQFVYGGCNGNVPFETFRECRNQCQQSRCELIPRRGRCDGEFPRAFFNTTTERCEEFMFGGCFGLVPFDTMSECRSSCGSPDPCLQRPNPGPCRAFSLGYFFNPETLLCESFVHGGCRGTIPFDTMEACENAGCTITAALLGESGEEIMA